MVNIEEPGISIRFWGVRGSYPTPGQHTVRHGGNTACVEVRVGGQRERTLIFDAGSGIIGLGSSLMQRSNERASLDLSLFITHAHGDHLVGFPFFTPLFDARTHLQLFGPQLAGLSIEELLVPLMSPPYFPVDIRQLPSQRMYHTVGDAQCVRWLPGEQEPMISLVDEQLPAAHDGEVRVYSNFTHSHPLNGAVTYRVEYGGCSVVYATDVEWSQGCEPSFLKFVAGADILIHDAQYTQGDYQGKQGFGHSTLRMATDVAKMAGVKELILFHHEPAYDDNQLDRMEVEARTYFARTRSACEGMEIDLTAVRNSQAEAGASGSLIPTPDA
ncbi:MBL fold metallo-hydrolase [Ktedonobacteria bacterium brp13]|nr:MBL fold metallo-hydrolase [Ktedonobacteria bacterium brp13]